MADDKCLREGSENDLVNGTYSNGSDCKPVEGETFTSDRPDSGFYARSYEAEDLAIHMPSTDDQNGVLDKKTIAVGLSDLGWSADGMKQTYLDLVIPGYQLRDISILKDYKHLQKLHLPHNQLEDLSILSNMPFLLELDVSNNLIKKFPNFSPLKNLRSINLSFNEIYEIADLSDLPNLQNLCLDNNKIAEIMGLKNCKSLVYLSLCHNRILEIKGLDHLPLRNLGLSCNQLRKIENLDSVRYLQTVELAGNKIRILSGLENHDFLEKIDLEDNCVIDLAEVQRLQDLRTLRSLNLLRNSVQELPDYRLNVLLCLPQLTELDRKRVIIPEKVEAVNAFMPSMEYLAARDHMMHVVYSFLQPTRILDITLPVSDTPYPMLVLVGPQGMGKRNLALKLVEEFPDYFGYAASHTTRLPRSDESLGRDYHFVSMDEFENGIKQGRFLQTCSHQGEIYGLTVDAVESVACESLACIVHMELEGVLSLKNSSLEPRYVLILPSEMEAFCKHLMFEGVYSESQISAIVDRCDLYKAYNQDHPGFFDATISSGDIVDAYCQLQRLVMEYLGITAPEGLLTRTTTDMNRENTDLSLAQEMERLSDEVQNQRSHSAPVLRGSWSKPAVVGTSGQETSKLLKTRAESSILPSARGEVEEKSLKNRFTSARYAFSSCSSASHKQLLQSKSWSALQSAARQDNPLSLSAPTSKDTCDILLLESPGLRSDSSSSLSNGSNNGDEKDHKIDDMSLMWSADAAALDTRLNLASPNNPRFVQSAGLVTPRPVSKSVSEPSDFPSEQPLSGKRPGSERLATLPPIGGQA